MWILPNCKCLFKWCSLNNIQQWASSAQWPPFFNFCLGLNSVKALVIPCFHFLPGLKARGQPGCLFLNVSWPRGSVEMFACIASDLPFGDYNLLHNTLCFWIFRVLKHMHNNNKSIISNSRFAWVLNFKKYKWNKVKLYFIMMTLVLLSKL